MNDTTSVKDTPHSRPHHVRHQQSSSDQPVEVDDPYDKMLERSGCVEYHHKLQDCFFDQGGDWRKCQQEMKEFKECMKNKQQQVMKKV